MQKGRGEPLPFGIQMMLIKHWAARYRPIALTSGAALAAGPVEMRSVMELNSQVVAVNTRPPSRPSFRASPAPTKQAAKGSSPKVTAENTGMQI